MIVRASRLTPVLCTDLEGRRAVDLDHASV